MYTAAVLTVSDRSFRGERPDEAGPLVASLLEAAGYRVLETAVVPDERPDIEAALIRLAGEAALVVTTGGTGFSPRDVTPEAMRAASMAITPRAMLSRATAGIRGGSLIVNLPGSPKAARENLEAVLPTLEHGLRMLLGGPANCFRGTASDGEAARLL